jgi:Family of unknown function (DUF6090)
MEHEVQAHTKKVYTVWNNPRKKSLEKVKEIAIEIGIIVFAISLSIWFHSWSQHRHEQKEVKAFLIGLKSDLDADIKEMNEDVESYIGTEKAFKYITSLKINEVASQDSINKYGRYISNTTGLIANAGRFEGFKSSGKIGHLENEQLQNDILDLYEEDIPHLLSNTDAFTKNKLEFGYFIKNNLIRVTDSTTNFKVIINSDKGFAHARPLSSTQEIVEAYNVVITKNKKIIAVINKQYNLK